MVRKLMLVLSLFLFIVPVMAIGEAPIFEDASCAFQKPSGADIDCGYLIVPENRNNPDSDKIRIAVAILRNPSENVEADPIIYLEGGPGGSALEFLYLVYADRYEAFFATNRDIIVLDQRGVGLSEPALDCPEYIERNFELLDYEYDGETLSLEDADALLTESLLACGERLASEHDLSGYNSVQNAADIEDLRIALGYQDVNLWGISYGTRLALAVMRDYPSHIRSVVIDSVYTPEVNLYAENPANFDRALTVLFETCAADEACNETFPNLRQTLFDTAAALNAEPVRLRLTNPFNGDVYENVVFDGYGLVAIIFQLLYDSNSLAALPQLIYDAHEGNFSTFQLIMGSVIAQSDVISNGMYFSVQCNEEIAFIERGDLDRAWADFPELAAFSNPLENGDAIFDTCAAFASGTAFDREQDAISSAIPTLVTTGQFDPITPPAWGEAAAGNLSNSVYINFPYTGHGGTGGEGCAQNIAIAFFNNPEPSAVDSACTSEMSLRFSGTGDSEVDFIPLELGEFGIDATTVIPDGWEGQGGVPGLFARGETSLDVTLIQFVVVPVALEADQVARAFQGTLDLDLAAVEVYEAANTDWSIYPIALQGNEGYLAVSIVNRKGVIVLMLGDDAVYDAVFIPILEAFALNE